MFRFWPSRAKTKNRDDRRSRRLLIEPLEKRRMLTTLADVVFLIDSSGSESQSQAEEWLHSIVPQLDATLRTTNGIDARYGLVRFSNFDFQEGFANSRIVDSNAANPLFSDVNHAEDLRSAILALPSTGIEEDGWDAIEHAIAEYDFRDNAVPVFVLLQNNEGRVPMNFTLTRSGILSALESKNVLLNTLTVGEQIGDTAAWKQLMDLAPYEATAGAFANRRVLGIEADASDGVVDGQHDYHLVDTTSGAIVTNKPATESDALQVSFNGSNTGATGMVASGKSILIGQNIMGGIGGSATGDYRAKSVPFTPVEMTTGTTAQTLNTAINFSFSFFGETKTQLWVHEDGTLTFTNSDPGGNNADLSRPPVGTEPARPSGPTITALWDNLAPGSTGQVLRKSVDADLDGTLDLVIQWTNFIYASDADPITFQAVLLSGGRIQFNYLDLEAHDDAFFASETGGVSATVGIWKGTADSITQPAGRFVPGLHSIGGDPVSEARDSYVRMSWDTGGAVWDIGIVPATGDFETSQTDALRDAFNDSLAAQILRAEAAGKVFHNDEVLLAINYGGPAIPAEGFTSDPVTPTADNSYTTVEEINVVSNSIPVDVNGAKIDNIFQTARTVDLDNGIVDDLQLTITTLNGGQALTAGSYFVELFFAEIDQVTLGFGRTFDVKLEGKTMLNDYEPWADFARIQTQPSAEFRTSLAEQNTGVVKRFKVEVGADGQAGLQIELIHSLNASLDPILNGVRILKNLSPVLLVGDYNRNGRVECADYSLWRATFGTVVTSFSGADGNGNGVIDAADYVVWANEYDAIAGGPIGDFDGSGTVGFEDYNLWKATFGSTTNLDADGNCNGVVDAADYSIWRDTFRSMVGAARFALLDAAFDPDTPPEVVGFLLAASGGSFDFTGIVGSGEQLRSVPLGGINSISITFNQAVSATQGALQLINLDGSAPSVTGFAYEDQAQTATWTFGSSLADGRYLVRLADSVQNANNEALDGEFTNPWSLAQTGSSNLPSGDGVAGGEFRFRFTVLAGDTDHNNIHGAVNYENWKSTEPGRVYVSTTTDDFDADLSFGDVSLREGVDYANTASEATTIELPAGHYYLSRSGTESTTNTSFNDLDIFGNVRIVGAGPGATTIDGGSLTTDDRLFDVASGGVLRIFGATLALGAAPTGSTQRDGGAVRVKDGGQLDLETVAVVGNETTRAGYGGAIYFAATAHGSITDSVITVNYADNMTGGVYLKNASAPGTGGAVTVTRSIIVNNTASDNTNTDVYAGLNRTFTSGGYNRLGNAATGFTNGVNGDYIKPVGTTVDFVVTSIVDTYDGSADPVNRSLRDAIHLANTTAGTQEIWLPAWDFGLTRERTTAANVAELNVSEGDLEILESTIIRGIGGASAPATRVGWASEAVVDKVFEVVGDGSGNGEVDTSDYVIWQNEENLTGPGLAADWDDDGDVDEDDYDLWAAKYGNVLELADVGV